MDCHDQCMLLEFDFVGPKQYLVYKRLTSNQMDFHSLIFVDGDHFPFLGGCRTDHHPL
jgi:hypothetical protein